MRYRRGCLVGVESSGEVEGLPGLGNNINENMICILVFFSYDVWSHHWDTPRWTIIMVFFSSNNNTLALRWVVMYKMIHEIYKCCKLKIEHGATHFVWIVIVKSFERRIILILNISAQINKFSINKVDPSNSKKLSTNTTYKLNDEDESGWSKVCNHSDSHPLNGNHMVCLPKIENQGRINLSSCFGFLKSSEGGGLNLVCNWHSRMQHEKKTHV